MTGLLHIDAASPLSYLVALLVPGLDALLPVLPSETVVIALGVATAGRFDAGIGALVALAAAGAFLGDSLSYWCGRRFGPLIERRFFRSGKGKQRRAWAEQALDRFGAPIIIACRFIPGGRTAVTLSCGMVGYPPRRFVAATACAGVIWASYAFFLGRLGGQAFEDQPWLGLLLALGATVLLSAVVEVIRRGRRRRPGPARSTRRPDPAPPPDRADCLAGQQAGSGRSHSDLAGPPG
jgi:membrane-associated protein